MLTAQMHEVRDPDGFRHEVTGELLAEVSSQRDHHNHPGDPHAPRGSRCSACRWFELRLIRRTQGGPRYLAATTGRSTVPGEETRYRMFQSDSPLELLELLTARTGGKVYLPKDTARAFAMAAEHDDGLYDAYVNRAVV